MRLVNIGIAAAALSALTIASTGAALADIAIKGKTAPQVDPRRTTSGAKITAETDPGADVKGEQDDKRLADSYQPKGVELGLFLLMPKIETEEQYNSNVFATRNDVKSDLLTVVRPEMTLRSRFSEHELSIHALAEKYLYRKFTADNRLDYAADVNGRYDVQAGTEVTGFAQYFSRHEDRSSPDEAGGLNPTPTAGIVGRLGGKHESGRYIFAAEVATQRLTFERVTTGTGTIVPNEDRDRWDLDGKVRGSYEMFPGYAAVTQVSANTKRYDQSHDRNGYERSSSGYRVEAGIGLDISQLLRGDFLVGYLAQDYLDPRFKDPQGLSLRATFNWTPDKLTIVVPTLERSVSETTKAGASGLVRTSGSVLVRHELARNILLSGYTSAAYSESVGVKSADWTYEGRLKATYALAPEAYIGTEAAYKFKDTLNDATGFRQTIVSVRLGLQL